MAKGLRVRVEIEGGEELLQKMRALGVDVDKVLEGAALEGAEPIRVVANRKAPGPHVVAEVMEGKKGRVTVGVGPDKDHWYYQFFETGAQAHEITGSPLAFPVEDGAVVVGRVAHPGMAAEPFLRPAFDGQKGKAEKRVGERIRQRIGSG